MSEKKLRIWQIVGLLGALGLLAFVYALSQIDGAYFMHPTNAASNASQIAKTYLSYRNAGLIPRAFIAQPGDTAHAAAFVLAQKGGLNDAKTWFFKEDPLRPKAFPKAVVMGNIESATALNPDFARATLSYEFAANIPTNAPSTTTPLVWTRGLRPDGTWAPDSPWHGEGGYLAFLDGHVEWFDKFTVGPNGNSLVVYPTRKNAGQPTANILEALPPEAVILSAEPRKEVGK